MSWGPRQVRALLQAEPAGLRAWLTTRPQASATWCVGAILLGCGLFGAVMGFWRGPLQALYTGIKLPLVIVLTTFGNGLLNGMLAPLLGLNLRFRQSLVLVMVSFAITSLILGALSPVAWFVVWNTPPLSASTRLWSPEYGGLQLILAACIAFAGIVGNLRLLPLLRQWTDDLAIARRVLFAWLAGNLFLGSQVCWVLRPFIWDPAGPVQFVGRQYFHGSFYETVSKAAWRLLGS
jgi:hypothetical protein